MGTIIGILSLIIYFIWGQGTACAWWMWIPIIGLIVSILSNIQLLNWLISLFLLGVTFFASPTFGYNETQINAYNNGFSKGCSPLFCNHFDAAWEEKENAASVDVSGQKRYFRYGFDRGAAGKKN